MGSLLRLLHKYQHLLLFLGLEVLVIYLHFDSSLQVKAQVGSQLYTLQGAAYQRIRTFTNYLHLREENLALVQENIMLRNRLEGMRRLVPRADGLLDYDSLQYRRIAAEVVHHTLSLPRNLFMLDRGSSDGVTENMPILSHGGATGIIVATTPHYSKAIALINTDLHMSAKLKRTNYFGSLAWDGVDVQLASLTEIPHHVDVRVGDSVVTSGFSNIFPPDILLGIVESVENRSGDFCTARVRFATDFRRLQHVVILDNRYQPEIDSLQRQE